MSRMDFRPAALQERQDQPRASAVAYVAGVSPEMQTIQRLIAEIAPTDIPILLMGESGTGKEIVALHIHNLSAYRDLPFVKLSCAAFTPESLQGQIEQLKSRGRDKHEKPAGTLFLDEVNELEARCQRNLLQCVPDGNDSSRDPLLPGRFISCTTQNLETEVSSGRFRSELFYRLNQICLRLPPLRNRKDDIPLLAQFFLSKYSTSFHRQEMSLSEKTLQLLIDYPWPGNIRELENVVKKIVALENEELGTTDLKARPVDSQAAARTGISRSLKATSRAASQLAERQLILQTLETTHWNRKRAAEALQISYKALLYKLKQIQLLDTERL